MIEKINAAVKIALDEWCKENEDLEDGDEFATVFNDGVIVIGIENRELQVKLLQGKPYILDYNIDLFE